MKQVDTESRLNPLPQGFASFNICFISVIIDMINKELAVSISLSGKIIYHPEEKQINA